MRTKLLVLMFAFACLATSLGGCSLFNSSNRSQVHYQTSLGQELLDLKRARDEEAISPHEYNVQKSRILKSRERYEQ